MTPPKAPEHTRTDPLPTSQLSLFGSILLGWKVLISELQWLALKGLRRWEIRQLRKRLTQEYSSLGRLTAREEEGDQESIDLCRRQIGFLQEEIDYLENELAAAREDLVGRRLQE